MQIAPLPDNEPERLLALHGLNILDTPPEDFYDDVTRLAAHICGVPKSLVSLVDADRQWFKSRYGVDGTGDGRDNGFCPHAILGEGIFEIQDALLDPRFHDNPNVTSADPVRFYAGWPLDLGDGTRVGTLCVFDSVPKKLDPLQREALACLGRQVEAGLRLRKSHEDLRKAHRAQTHFLAAMGHEVRTPLNGILGLTDVILGESRESATLEKLKVVRDCGRNLLGMLNDILDYSKLSGGKVALERIAFSPAELLDGARRMFTPLAAAKGLALEFATAGLPDRLAGDPGRIRQTLGNLLSNALKFTAQGEIKVRASCEDAGNGQARLTIAVADQGIGIPAEALERLFQPFQQADASTTRRFGGTGLGLAIVKELAEAMGGSVAAESGEGKGSTFTLRILCGTAVAEAPAPEADPAASGAPARDLEILLAEDDPVNQLVAQLFLEQLGYRADLAETGTQAVERARAKRYDVILMDCFLPGLDGYQATRRIREEAGDSAPAIYGVTASLKPRETADWTACGMDGILEKPLDAAALGKLLAGCRKRA